MDETVNDLIPQPLSKDLPKIGRRVRAIGDLLKEKGVMESSMYERFKDHRAENNPRGNGRYSPQRWACPWDLSMTAEYPVLARFDNRWPLILYFNECVNNAKRVKPELRMSSSSISGPQARKENVFPSSVVNTTDQVQDLTVSTQGPHARTSVRMVRQYVGKTPPKCHLRSLHLVNTHPMRERTTGSTSQAKPQHFGRATEMQVTQEQFTTMIAYNAEILLRLRTIAPLLKLFGIHHDGHLYLLHLLKPTERREVLKGIPSVPAVDTYVLIKHLENWITGRDYIHMRDSSNAIEMFCDEHRASFKSKHPVSPILESILKMKGLEVLVRIAALYGVSDDRQVRPAPHIQRVRSGSFFQHLPPSN
ncbi:hypothetical protein L218DRAFT_1073966 [Marasmius fiardii PR-910]|nr:hypothetical protein L218DRAFT_1073966 [Marasmius fiardii PR-910]